MKVINNQWQLSSAICLLIITLLTPRPPRAPKPAVTANPWAHFTAVPLKLWGVVTSLQSVITVYAPDSMCMCVQAKQSTQGYFYAAPVVYLHLHGLHFSTFGRKSIFLCCWKAELSGAFALLKLNNFTTRKSLTCTGHRQKKIYSFSFKYQPTISIYLFGRTNCHNFCAEGTIRGAEPTNNKYLNH